MPIRSTFHTFDALRFFSFFMVFMWHLPYGWFPSFAFLQLRGDVGVSFFFTLSGFLITYIILEDKTATGSFSFKKYMMRRILRIWPLYYLVVLFAFCTPYLLGAAGIGSNSVGYEPNWLFSCLFLENYMLIAHHDYANVSPLPVTWTVCVEEHFYLVWGAVLYFSGNKKIPYWIGLFIALAFVSRIVFLANGWYLKDLLTNFDYFMYGAVPAWLLANSRQKTLEKINSIPGYAKRLTIAALIVYALLSLQYHFPGKELVEPLVFGLLFMALLFILLPRHNRFRIPDGSLFSRLGKYTYGNYLLHVIAINFVMKAVTALGLVLSDAVTFILVFTASALLTIGAAMLSFHFYEKPFLRLKPKH